ncbi:HlyC/CorC family transporter [Streptomyces sp. F63]|uniref:hemolysin family protein n=1 Tax=Streptomyces sp. F63 TaxID=2824887 RepID=UPI001B3990B7|nr:hemolysin family protein [Streptomyces sp. F63]MBQ0984110.1 HlyC/CorC family transporter [Streptomyces sp. F63]
MDGYGWELALVAVLIVLNALFAGSEIALISLRESRLRLLRRGGGANAARLVRLAEDPNRYLATIQVGITLAGFLASATAAVSLAEPVSPRLSFLGAAAEPVAVALVTAVLTFVTLVAGELAPKRLALQFAERWALLAATPLTVLSAVSRPVIWALGRSTNAVVRLLGGDPHAGREPPTPEELKDMVVGQRGLTAQQRRILAGALELHERILRDVLVPRRSVFTLAASLPAAEARAELAGAGHSRAPVVRAGHFEDVVGVVRLRDLTTSDDMVPVAEVARPAVVFSDFMKVSEALRRFRADRQQFALVVDEYGSVQGIVTIEDLLEEIVGEIYDETDRDVLSVRRQPDGSLLLPGSFPVHDLPDIGVEVDDPARRGRFTTIAGLVLDRLGRIPRGPGAKISLNAWDVEVTEVDHHAVTGVRLRRHTAGEREDDGREDDGPAGGDRAGGGEPGNGA